MKYIYNCIKFDEIFVSRFLSLNILFLDFKYGAEAITHPIKSKPTNAPIKRFTYSVQVLDALNSSGFKILSSCRIR